MNQSTSPAIAHFIDFLNEAQTAEASYLSAEFKVQYLSENVISSLLACSIWSQMFVDDDKENLRLSSLGSSADNGGEEAVHGTHLAVYVKCKFATN